ncbi:ThuA domain-containing protein [Flavivirga aquimarina]|uniref:ThuA domain-containing protein n=1 Tax=Flavivirga aquimarina TaxID=2027862 RepID=A0ABT8W611_9FLAO|nr:ThuA domain-containing protein [Flavivirga aquimarina]MDO5968548.1 ThuA domain-containing protein [Flavivirga aquimarina]
MKSFKKSLILFGILFTIVMSLKAQNRYYDYRDRNPEGKTHILYVAGGSWHDHLGVAAVLRRFLEVRHDYHITYSEDFNVFTRSLDSYDVIIMNGMPASMTNDQFTGFSKAVEEGKPILGLHSATAALKKDEKHKVLYNALIGADFSKHPPIHTFPVKIIKPSHPIVENIGDFTIYDEMYFYHGQVEGNTVLIEAEHEGVKTPIAWTRTYGKGKVFYTSLGHSVGAATNKYFQQLVLNALIWLTE